MPPAVIQTRKFSAQVSIMRACTRALYTQKRRLKGRRFMLQMLLKYQAFGAQTEHQPAAATALPGKIWQGRHASPSAP